ncbi:MAG: response regulator, partial [Parafilimonas sp.]
MQTIKCIIADDEHPARELIQLYLEEMEGFELLGTFSNALDTFNFMQNNVVDLLFLDIQMPKVSGVELIKSLKVCPKIILTTAFREYAAEAFELDVLDYLVKPITHERFMKAISKYNFYKNKVAEKKEAADTFDQAYIFFKTGK